MCFIVDVGPEGHPLLARFSACGSHENVYIESEANTDK